MASALPLRLLVFPFSLGDLPAELSPLLRLQFRQLSSLPLRYQQLFGPDVLNPQ